MFLEINLYFGTGCFRATLSEGPKSRCWRLRTIDDAVGTIQLEMMQQGTKTQ
jgi:hypothetical protein